MGARVYLVLFVMLGTSVGAEASSYHESLWPGVSCASDDSPAVVRILEKPDSEGLFKINGGLCRALPSPSLEDGTLFAVAHCVLHTEQAFVFMFGGWLNMLTVRFSNTDESQDLFCR